MTARGRFLSFEGGEGVGKSTQIARVAEFLRGRGIDVVLTREPGGTDVGERLRELLLDKTLPSMHHDTELMLMYAARKEHIEQLIEPALAKGRWVISDRFADASVVYQGYGRGIDLDRLAELDRWVLQGFKPDKTFLLDMPVEQGLARARKRAELDRFESETLAFFERVRQGYLDCAAAEPDRFAVIDAAKNIESVTQSLLASLESWLTQ
ncbi:MAG: dTMP kinase [Thiotrichales bacterium]